MGDKQGGERGIGAMETIVSLPVPEQVAAVNWLNSRVAADLRRGRDAAAIVGAFLRLFSAGGVSGG